MKLDAKILDEMIEKAQGTEEQLKKVGYHFWISKEYTEYPRNHKDFQVYKTQVLTGDTVYLSTELAFFKSKL